MVDNSSLVIERKHFKKNSRTIFNPCFNPVAKTMLYIRYTFRGLERVLIYDLSKETLQIPHD